MGCCCLIANLFVCLLSAVLGSLCYIRVSFFPSRLYLLHKEMSYESRLSSFASSLLCHRIICLRFCPLSMFVTSSYANQVKPHAKAKTTSVHPLSIREHQLCFYFSYLESCKLMFYKVNSSVLGSET